MKTIITTILFSLALVFNANAQFGDLVKKGKDMLTAKGEDNTAMALKEALDNGVQSAVKQLARENGYYDSPYKVLIPEDAQKVVSKVKMVPGFQDVEEKLVNQMNQAAELAADKAAPIFLSAIKNMSIKDGLAILMGEQNAATSYLEANTRTNLYREFMPVIRESLEEVNALTYWKSVVTAYNQIPFVKKQNPELDDHVNNKALDGMFGLIEQKEKGIRSDKTLRNTKLLQDVFAKQDK
jgi:hypothetical protein